MTHVDDPMIIESCYHVSTPPSDDEQVLELTKTFLWREEANRASTSEDCQAALRSGTTTKGPQIPKEVAKDKNKEGGNQPLTSEKGKMTIGDYNVLAHLRKIPALMSVFDALMMSQELRDNLIYALQHPEQFQCHFASCLEEEALYIERRSKNITFTEDDLLIGTPDHNRPLYVTGECEGKKLSRILVDAGSSINIMSLKTLHGLALSVKSLAPETITIHEFNQNSKQSVGFVILNLKLGKLETRPKLYVIDADNSYKALFGRPWLHEHRVVPSTFHQCMKYAQGGKVRRIDGDIKPFRPMKLAIKMQGSLLRKKKRISLGK
jgi:hypothetical protein